MEQSIGPTTTDLTRSRKRAAIAVAVLADALQLLLGPMGLVGVDQAVDLVAAVLIVWLIGFHPLLLPTFVVELVPMADLLPTWTGCVLLVLARKKKAQLNQEPARVIVHPPE